jgi:hypothetical protein
MTVTGLCLVLVVVGIVAAPEWYRDWTLEVQAPRLQRCFGFTAAPARLGSGGQEFTALTITSVDAGSPLAKAGVKTGDVPVGYQHGQVVGFYSDLDYAATGGDVTFSVIAISDWARGREALRSIRLAMVSRQCR